MVSGGYDGTVRIWDPTTGAQVGHALGGRCVNSVAVREVGGAAWVVSGGDDGTVRIWDPTTGAKVSQALRGHEDWVN